MTLNSLTNRIDHVPDGEQTVFTYNFLINDADDVVIYEDGLEYHEPWTITGLTEAAGGEVTFATAPPADIEALTILRKMSLTQSASYPTFGPFPAKTHERVLDEVTMMIQQQQEVLNRTSKGPVNYDPTVDPALPGYNAGKGLMWDEVEKRLTVTDDDVNGILPLAEKWAENPEDTPVTTGKYSALHWAAKAEEFSQTLPSGTSMVFYQAAVPVGWTKKNDWASNATIIVGNTFGSGGSNNPISWGTGITVAPHSVHTHTGPNHQHTGPNHRHTGPSHNHQWYNKETVSPFIDDSYNSSGSLLQLAVGSSHSGIQASLSESSLDAEYYTSNGGTGNTGYGGTGNTGYEGTGDTSEDGPTAHTVGQSNYTPIYQIMIVGVKN